MKNFIKITSIMLLVLFTVGCSNGLLQTTYTGSDKNGEYLVSFSISNYSTNFARTILPNDDTLKDEIKSYSISGISSRGKKIQEQEVLVDDSGKGSIVLTSDLWELTLTAKNEAGNTLLQATTQVDLTKKQNIIFTLSEKGVKTGGTVDLRGTYADTENVVNYTISGLYDILTGEKVEAVDLKEEKTAGQFTFSKDSLPPGEYIFKVELMGNSGTPDDKTDDVVLGVWADVVKVAPGRTTTKTDITIGQHVLGQKPTAPENLMAYYVKGSEQKDDTYKVLLKWKDNSDNETSFKITVTEYTDKENPSENKTEYTVLSSVTEKEIELDLGKLYDVSIVATNKLGDSTECPRVTATPINDDDSKVPYTFDDDTKNYRINRFKITYNLNGGTYTDGETTVNNANIVKYYTYNSEKTTLITNGGENNVSIKKGDKDIEKWIEIDGNDNDDGILEYPGFTNYSVKAVYDAEEEFTVELPKYVTLELNADYFNLTFDNELIDPIDLKTTNSINVSTNGNAKGNGTITLNYVDVADGTKYEEYQVILIGGNLTSSTPVSLTGKTYEINTEDLASATYTLVAIAKETGTDNWYSHSVTFTVAR